MFLWLGVSKVVGVECRRVKCADRRRVLVLGRDLFFDGLGPPASELFLLLSGEEGAASKLGWIRELRDHAVLDHLPNALGMLEPKLLGHSSTHDPQMKS